MLGRPPAPDYSRLAMIGKGSPLVATKWDSRVIVDIVIVIRDQTPSLGDSKTTSGSIGAPFVLYLREGFIFGTARVE